MGALVLALISLACPSLVGLEHSSRYCHQHLTSGSLLLTHHKEGRGQEGEAEHIPAPGHS